MMRPPLDVVIAARGEHEGIATCLEAMVPSADSLNLRVIVAANGPDWERTVGAAEQCRSRLQVRGAQILVDGETLAGKAQAFNRADQHRRDCAVVYLDADVQLGPGALEGVASVLRQPQPCLAAPRMQIRPPGSLVSHHYARIWRELPAVAADVMGGGCYAVNPAGRARWGAFPPLIADDAFARTRFRPEERRVVDGVMFETSFPEWPELAGAVRRWRDGNQQLRAVPAWSGDRGSDPASSAWRNVRYLASRPDLWASVPWFVLVRLASHCAPPVGADNSWVPVRPRADNATTGRHPGHSVARRRPGRA
jgi:hypothetical protein